mgnify:FL=1
MPLDIIREVDVEDAERYKIGFRSYIRDDFEPVYDFEPEDYFEPENAW